MSSVYWWIPFGINFLLYGICCLLIIKRKTYTMISIRSPTLLLSTILGNLFMSLVIILFKITGQNFFSSFYYLFRIMMIVSLFLRYERIILCCGINKNDENDMKHFSTKRYLYIEKFYVRLLMIIIFLFLLVTIIIRALKKEYFEIFFTNENTTLNETKSWIWVIWNFFEAFLILTYLFRIYDLINLQQYIRFELYTFLIVWFIYTNLLSIMAFINKNKMDDDNNTFAILTLTILYVCLIINGYLPIILSFTSRTLVLYHFTNKLLSNLYLFLTDESCYESFNNYLINKKTDADNGPFYLKLYTNIMKFKLFFVLNPNIKALGQNEARNIYNTFFEEETYSRYFEAPDIFIKIRRDKDNLNKNSFDEALQYCFNKLNNYFIDYKNSREFNLLQAKISLESYVRCKMVNSGLINKF